MEEDHQEITGWDDQENKILQIKSPKRHKKRLTQISTYDYQVERRLRPSNTLPVIKNLKHSILEPIIDIKQRKEDSNIDKLIETTENKIIKMQKANRVKDNINVDGHQLLIGRQRNQKQHSFVNLFSIGTKASVQKGFRKVKQTSTVIKGEKVSNFEQLKVQANEYTSTPRHSSIQQNSRSKQLLMKISKNSSTHKSKNQKSKYFIVKNQKISPKQLLQDISKIAVQGIKSNDDENGATQQNKSNVLKQKYKNIIKSIEGNRKNICSFFNSQSQQLKQSIHKRRYTNPDGQNEVDKQQTVIDQKIQLVRQRFNITTLLRQSIESQQSVLNLDSRKMSKVMKLNKIHQQSQKISKNSKITRQKSIKVLRTSNQNNPAQIMQENYMQKTQNLTMLLNNKMKNTPFDNSVNLKQIKQILKQKIANKSMLGMHNNQRSFSGQNYSIAFNEFSDEGLFVSK